MRDQFYGDRKDLWKWTVVAREAQQIQAIRIVYIAMMRPNDNAEVGHGGNFGPCAGAAERIVAFFDQEHQDFGLQNDVVMRPYLRRVARVTALAERTHIPIAYVGAMYRAVGAPNYFAEQVLPWLDFRAPDKAMIALLDPDTGVAQAQIPNNKQLGITQLLTVWNALRRKDVLVLYSEPAFGANALQQEAVRVQAILNVAVTPSPFPFNTNQGYLIATKP